MQLGAQAVFVGSGIFKSADPAPFAKAIVEATTHFNDPAIVAKVSRGLGDAMRGEDIRLRRRQARRSRLVKVWRTRRPERRRSTGRSPVSERPRCRYPAPQRASQ